MDNYDTVIVGAGFTGLTAAYELSKQGKKVLVVESDSSAGGLAGTFTFPDGVRLEKFYHHWFNNDTELPRLARELGLEQDILCLPTRTGIFFNGRIWNLSTPLDLLRFTPLSFIDRLRLGFLVLLVRRIKDWKTIEHLSIREWLEPLCGKAVYRLVWEPLITSKFSIYAETINAVWMWKKLVLRGGTRNSSGGEELVYFKGGFGRLTDALEMAITNAGGKVLYGVHVTGVVTDGTLLLALQTDQGDIAGKRFLFTPAFPIIADLFAKAGPDAWVASLRRVRYLANICLVLRLRQNLSTTYWLNVNDPGFPFVGVIEHTNFDTPQNYNGSHIVFLSKYLSTDDPIWQDSDSEYFAFAFAHLKRMFPHLDASGVTGYSVWRTPYGQHVTERGYSDYVPAHETPYENAWVATMAQIYPEDRGTNYAIRDGKNIAAILAG